jgi:hypothetical protein
MTPDEIAIVRRLRDKKELPEFAGICIERLPSLLIGVVVALGGLCLWMNKGHELSNRTILISVCLSGCIVYAISIGITTLSSERRVAASWANRRAGQRRANLDADLNARVVTEYCGRVTEASFDEPGDGRRELHLTFENGDHIWLDATDQRRFKAFTPPFQSARVVELPISGDVLVAEKIET